MTEKFLSSIVDPSQSISIDPSALLTTSTINALHFPDLSTSGISDTGTGRPTSLNLEGVGMCESMTESYCSTHGQDEGVLINSALDTTSMTNSLKHHGKKDPSAQKKRRSRKAQYDASVDGFSLEKIEPVNLAEELNEPDDAWLFQIPGGNGKKSSNENIFSWVHKEFKENEINANKHRLLCKLDDVSHARTIRSISCHNFPAKQRSDSVKRSSTEQQVNPEPVHSSRLTSPLRSSTPQYNPNGSTRPTSPAGASPLRHTVAITNTIRSRDVSREREPLDYTDLEVMAKVQLENLRQAERQGPLSKRFGGSNVSLASTNSANSVSFTPNRPGTKPPAVPKSVVPRNGIKPNNHRRSNTQTIVPSTANGFDIPDVTDPLMSPTTPTNARPTMIPPTATSTPASRPRPPAPRPVQAYRGSQTTFNNTMTVTSPAPAATAPVQQRPMKKTSADLGSTFTARQFAPTENTMLNDVSNRPLTNPMRTQVINQRRSVLPQSSVEQVSASIDTSANVPTSIPRSASTLSQGRKSGIPTIGKQSKPPTSTMIRPPSSNVIPSSQSSDSMMMTRNIRPQNSIARPQIPDATSPTSSWNEGCY